LYQRVIDRILKRITTRRSNSDVAYIGQAGKRFSKANKALIHKYPLRPFETYIDEDNKRTHKHLEKKFKGITSLPIEAIVRSSITEHERLTLEELGFGTIRAPLQ
jgi:hypothetical protein